MQGRHRDTENRHVDAAGREGESGMKWETGIDMYAPPCAPLVTSRKLLCSAGRSTQGSLVISRGGIGGGLGGLCVHMQLIHFFLQQKRAQHCEAIIVQ